MITHVTDVRDLEIGDKILWVEEYGPKSPTFRKITDVAWGPGKRARRVEVENSLYTQWFDGSAFVLTAS